MNRPFLAFASLIFVTHFSSVGMSVERTFLDWCEDSNADSAVKLTVQLLKAEAKTEDCKKAHEVLKSENSLTISEGNGRGGLQDLRPIASLKQLKSLSINYQRISDLSPLSGLEDLESLSLRGNRITDLSALSGLKKLSQLRLQDNAISDLAPLRGLNLQNLAIDNNRISSLDDLSEMTQLSMLSAAHNFITEVNRLPKFSKLSLLDLSYNRLTKISALGTLPEVNTVNLQGNLLDDAAVQVLKRVIIYRLNLSMNALKEVSTIEMLFNGESLDNLDISLNPFKGRLSLQKTRDLNKEVISLGNRNLKLECKNLPCKQSPSASFKTSCESSREPIVKAILQTLKTTDCDAAESRLEEIRELIARPGVTSAASLALLHLLPNLESLTLIDAFIVRDELIEVTSLPKLTKLSLDNSELVRGVDSLLAMNGRLKILDLRYTSEEEAKDGSGRSMPYSITAIKHLTSLEELVLSRANVTDHNAIRSLTGLKSLYLNGLGLTDLEFLTDLKALTALYIHETGISDITPISSLSELREFSAVTNKIQVADALSNLRNLTFINLAENPVSDFKFLDTLPSLTGLNVTATGITDLAPIARFENQMTFLSTGRNPSVRNKKVIGKLKKLTYLWMADSELENVDYLSDLSDLEYLILKNNKLKSVDSLGRLKKLKELHLQNNPDLPKVCPLPEQVCYFQ